MGNDRKIEEKPGQVDLDHCSSKQIEVRLLSGEIQEQVVNIHCKYVVVQPYIAEIWDTPS